MSAQRGILRRGETLPAVAPTIRGTLLPTPIFHITGMITSVCLIPGRILGLAGLNSTKIVGRNDAWSEIGVDA